MNWEILLAQYGLYVTTLIVCLVGGIVPVVNTEAYMIAISFLSDRGAGWPIILIASLSHVAAKTLIYLTGRGVLNLPLRKYEDRIESVKERMDRWKASPALFIFVSAGFSVPPFYLVSVVAGVLKYNYVLYMIASLLGLSLRYTIVVQFPHVLMRLF